MIPSHVEQKTWRERLFELKKRVDEHSVDLRTAYQQLEEIDRSLQGLSASYDKAVESIPFGIRARNTLDRALQRRLDALAGSEFGAVVATSDDLKPTVTNDEVVLKAYKVMLCYTSNGEGKRIAEDAYRILTGTLGLEVYLDKRDSYIGQDIYAKSYIAARNTPNLVVICTPELSNCDICHREIAHALAMGNCVLPVTTNKTCGIGAMPWLTALGALNWTHHNDDNLWRDVVKGLNKKVRQQMRLAGLRFLLADQSLHDQEQMFLKLQWSHFKRPKGKEKVDPEEIIEYVTKSPKLIEILAIALEPV